MDGHPLWIPAKPAIIRPAEPALIKPDKIVRGNLVINNLIGFGAGSSETTGNDAFTKVLLHMDGADTSTTFTDDNAGGSAHTWTAAGNAQIDTAQSKFGGASGLFDGTGDAVTSPDHADFEVTGDYTIDCWLRANSIVGNQAVFAKTPADNFGPYMVRSESGALKFYASSTGASHDIANAVDAGSISTGIWYHLAVVRSGNNYFTFLDGVQQATFSNSSTPHNNATALRIGVLTSLNFWNGWIDEFRLSHTARWTSNFTPPTVAYS